MALLDLVLIKGCPAATTAHALHQQRGSAIAAGEDSLRVVDDVDGSSGAVGAVDGAEAEAAARGKPFTATHIGKEATATAHRLRQ